MANIPPGSSFEKQELVCISRRQIVDHILDQVKNGTSIARAIDGFIDDAANLRLRHDLQVALHGSWARGRKISPSEATVRRWIAESLREFHAARRTEALRLLAEGVAVAEVARSFNVTRRTILNWRTR